MPNTFRRKLSKAAPWVMMAVLCLSNAVLIDQNLSLRAELKKFEPNVVKPGQQVSALSGVSFQGEPVTVNYSGDDIKYVFLYFTPDCPYCAEQLPLWRQIVERVDRNRFHLLGLAPESRDKARFTEYLKSSGCDSLEIAFVNSEMRRNYKLTMTPLTLVVSGDGKIERVWTGKWNSEMLADASAVFGIKFSTNN